MDIHAVSFSWPVDREHGILLRVDLEAHFHKSCGYSVFTQSLFIQFPVSEQLGHRKMIKKSFPLGFILNRM